MENIILNRAKEHGFVKSEFHTLNVVGLVVNQYVKDKGDVIYFIYVDECVHILRWHKSDILEPTKIIFEGVLETEADFDEKLRCLRII